jgi:hypothetical protein
MTERQYAKARMELLHKIQDILDTKSPTIHERKPARAVNVTVMMSGCLKEKIAALTQLNLS